MELVFATQNKNKIAEVQALMPDGIRILSLSDIGCHEVLEESQPTIEGNAIQKATYVFKNYGYNCFADDTGLEVDALNGEPGVYSARYAGEACSAEDNMNKLLQALNNNSNRNARFKTVIALFIDERLQCFTGICKGSITKKKMGEHGFGYDPIFKPEGHRKTFGQMDSIEKNRISHRALAVNQLIDFMNRLSSTSNK
ncbi:MAG: non-canonical purine NTP diphosphatase [Flavobacteriaceae bacterium]|nr:non-canonical purine NTP diphosphatase [Bacteroidia bacterium]MBT8287467.1 non-canonical purine NTP diphosphatase [Bacteroidia bacterium]NNF75954.1 non-canonical purine NTP diphosphatase [Flavobacteriaceae bacterium]NNK73878.1 non-canonical purine NTP diphosphatase [Flavobacteriaceae bacterium]